MIVADIDLALSRFNSVRVQQGQAKLTAQELAARIGIAPENLSKLRNGHFNAVRRSTLDGICRELGCQPGDLLRHVPDSAAP